MNGSIGSLMGAAASGVAGVRRAGALHEKSADTVQRSFHGEGSQTPLRQSDGAASSVSLSSVSQDLAGAFTDMMKADAMNQASVAVIKTSDEMLKELTDIVG